MKTNQEIFDWFSEYGYDEPVLFENPSYASAFIGTDSEGRAIYDYNLMVEYLVQEEHMTEDDAVDFISYNTLRSLPYFAPNCPIVLIRNVEL